SFQTYKAVCLIPQVYRVSHVSDGVEHSPVICKRSVDIRLNLTGYAVLSFNLIGCQCVNFRYILLLHQCETVVSHW
ncbi:hypothetical protein KSV00_03160, partial [Phocaeicola vulgatus]|uniref:hypothetical protein n=1 Tax=Phocaeicola vulgatus TaxID=821 RepID=UPI001C38965B